MSSCLDRCAGPDEARTSIFFVLLHTLTHTQTQTHTSPRYERTERATSAILPHGLYCQSNYPICLTTVRERCPKLQCTKQRGFEVHSYLPREDEQDSSNLDENVVIFRSSAEGLERRTQKDSSLDKVVEVKSLLQRLKVFMLQRPRKMQSGGKCELF